MEETLPGSEEDSILLSSCLGKFFSRLKIAKEQSAFFTNNVIFNKKNSYNSVFTEQLSSTYYLYAKELWEKLCRGYNKKECI